MCRVPGGHHDRLDLGAANQFFPVGIKACVILLRDFAADLFVDLGNSYDLAARNLLAQALYMFPADGTESDHANL